MKGSPGASLGEKEDRVVKVQLVVARWARPASDAFRTVEYLKFENSYGSEET